MGKKKGGKRMNKKQMAEALQGLFAASAGETLSLKYIFKQLGLDTHPLKMLAVDVLEEMAWDDYLTRMSDNSYRLNTKTQVQEGKFRRKANGKNFFVPDDGSEPVFVAERNSMSALDGDRVQAVFMARRPRHIKEASITAILQRARDTFVGKLRVDKDMAVLVTPDNIFVHDIIIPKRKLKGGKTGQKAVVRITQWPDAEHKYPVGEVIDVLGDQGDNDVEMNAILAQYGLPYKYPKAVEEAARERVATTNAVDNRHDVVVLALVEVLAIVNKGFPAIVRCRKRFAQRGNHIFEAELFHHALEYAIVALGIGLTAFHIGIGLEAKAKLRVLFVAYANVNILHQRLHDALRFFRSPKLLTEIEVYGNCHAMALGSLAGKLGQFCGFVADGRSDAAPMEPVGTFHYLVEIKV